MEVAGFQRLPPPSRTYQGLPAGYRTASGRQFNPDKLNRDVADSKFKDLLRERTMGAREFSLCLELIGVVRRRRPTFWRTPARGMTGYRLVTRIGGEDLELFGLDGTEIGEKNLSWRDCNEKSGNVREMAE